MKTRNWLGFLLVLALFNGACATSRSVKREAPEITTPGLEPKTGVDSPPPLVEEMGPPDPPAISKEPIGPEPAKTRPLTVVLAPGLARSFAGAGVLVALEQARIPVRAVLATETSAPIAAIYATSSSVGDFEFKLMRLREESFRTSGLVGGLLGRVNDGSEINSQLEQILGQKEGGESRVGLSIYYASLSSRQVSVWGRGPLARGARAAMGVPGFLRPLREAGQELGSAATIDALNLSFAREIAQGGPVLVVDVVSVKSEALTKMSSELSAYVHELERGVSRQASGADLVLKPDLKTVSYLDFKRRSDAVFRGKQAVQKNLEQIKRLVGMEVKP